MNGKAAIEAPNTAPCKRKQGRFRPALKCPLPSKGANLPGQSHDDTVVFVQVTDRRLAHLFTSEGPDDIRCLPIAIPAEADQLIHRRGRGEFFRSLEMDRFTPEPRGFGPVEFLQQLSSSS